MNLIIPMAGWGSRLRPHTLTIPKPLVPIAGKSIVERLASDLIEIAPSEVENIVFIIREEFGADIESKLMEIADELGVAGHIRYQDSPEGTAHAILCAGEFLDAEIIIAFADTLFKSKQKIDTSQDGVIFVKHIENPSAFGVVKLNDDNVITDFIEKPTEPISNLAIIGIYYIKDGKAIHEEMQYLIDNNIREKGEYQLTNALESFKSKGNKLIPGEVEAWLDCGNKDNTVFTNQMVLEFNKDTFALMNGYTSNNSIVIQPCYIAEGVELHNSVIGPHVTIHPGSKIENSIIKNSIVNGNSVIKNKILENSMIGNYVTLNGRSEDLSIGDYTAIK